MREATSFANKPQLAGPVLVPASGTLLRGFPSLCAMRSSYYGAAASIGRRTARLGSMHQTSRGNRSVKAQDTSIQTPREQRRRQGCHLRRESARSLKNYGAEKLHRCHEPARGTRKLGPNVRKLDGHGHEQGILPPTKNPARKSAAMSRNPPVPSSQPTSANAQVSSTTNVFLTPAWHSSERGCSSQGCRLCKRWHSNPQRRNRCRVTAES